MNIQNNINVIEEGRKIDLNNVLNKAGINVTNKKAICPFHSDTRPSLSLWKEKNMFKCFVCGEKGDPITFWNKFYNFNDYLLAAADLCFTFNIISTDDYNNIIEWRKKGIPSKKSSTKETNYFYTSENTTDFDEILKIMKSKDDSLNIASNDMLHKVYTIFIETIKIFYNKSLSSKHINDLISNRKMSLNEIFDTGYFTFPTEHREDFMDVFLDNLKKHNISPLVLKTVPGFYFNKKLNQFTFVKKEGLCIPIKDLDNQIIRIQLRSDNHTNYGSKYTWFSSSFAKIENQDFKWGTSSSSISTCFIPSIIGSKSIIITEGHFKAKKLCQEKNCITISVQGVSNWKSIIPVLNEINSKYTIDSIYIAFDCDFKYNDNVFNYAKLLSETLEKKNYKIYYMVWKYKLGKGIDDVINNGHINSIKIVEKNQLEEKMHIINKLLYIFFNKEILTRNNKKNNLEILEDEPLNDLLFYLNYSESNQSIHPHLYTILKKEE